ncbi:glycoside hydrolase family 97 protein [Litorilituus sediminis]|uniref:Glycoside hydrolase family 97 protein n=1 Tax=Litorilituus sediminis TaxID=718192 RepID=A0A4P6P0K0_9GAMM|nr:glycoside hydrolase family 97 protein [Litorilituus sediminis]QBG34413.1 glycoside hydrolase family 97 protein [Litorilituus sediminis]
MRKILFFTVFTCLVFPAMAQVIEISSPDKNITVRVNTASGKVQYDVLSHQELIISQASAGIHLADITNNGLHYQSHNVSSTTRTITPVVQQKSQHIIEHYNQLTIRFLQHILLEFRVFNEGVAYRFRSDAARELTVLNEEMTLAFNENYKVFYPKEKSFYSHNERAYLPTRLNQLTEQDLASLPLLVQTPKQKIVFTETALHDYPGLWVVGGNNHSLSGVHPKRVKVAQLKPGSDRNQDIKQRYDDIAKQTSKQKKDFPWRIFAISQTDEQLLTNELSFLLANELAIEDPSWIKPGKVAWDWWNANNLYGVDFKAGINTQTYKHYIDFAAEYGIEYIILDEGWYELGDALKIVPDIDLAHLIAYGQSKNVDIILWVIWETVAADLENILAQYADWGVKGIKVDFMQRDDQAMVQYYWRVAKVAADNKLLVNFHGSYKPAGLRRTYPNVITREGVRGLEHNKWADYITSKHNLTLPFIRMLAGPMDYTPGAMVNSQPENFSVSFNRPMSKTTRAHQIALYIVFESPLQMLADSPSNYLANKPSTEFISHIPTVWDETQVLSAKFQDHIITARRSDKAWYIGIMGNEQARTFDLDLNFLSAGRYQLTSMADGINADKYASDIRQDITTVTKQSKFSVTLAPNGGWAARIVPLP